MEITGYAYFKEITRIAAEEKQKLYASKDDKDDVAINRTVTLCHKCGKRAVRKQVQMRAGDEGSNTVIECSHCKTSIVVG